MKENIEEIKKHNLKTKILLGGAALTEGFVANECEPILPGLVYYCRDAFNAINYLSGNKTTQKTANIKPENNNTKHTEKITRIDRSDKETIEPPFIGYKIVENIKLDDFIKLLNKYTLFNTRWGFKKNNMSENEYNELLKDTSKTFDNMIANIKNENIINTKISYGYFYCKAADNSLIVFDENKNEIETITLPRQREKPYLCIADYFKSDDFDILPLQIVTIGEKAVEFCKNLHDNSKYKDYFLYHGLFTEITEALAEYWHLVVRKELKINNHFDRNPESILRLKYQGRRYSFGYPSCPDLEGNEKIGKLLRMDKIGVTLTETFLMVPEFSTSALIVPNKMAEYFTV